MTKVLRLTEGDIKSLVSTAANKILREMIENENAMLSQIVDAIHKSEPISVSPHQKDPVEIWIDDNTVADIHIYIDDNRYIKYGDEGNGYDIPPSPDEIIGDYNIEVVGIDIWEDGDVVAKLKDNGMVADALMDFLEVDEDNLPDAYDKYSFEDY